MLFFETTGHLRSILRPFVRLTLLLVALLCVISCDRVRGVADSEITVFTGALGAKATDKYPRELLHLWVPFEIQGKSERSLIIPQIKTFRIDTEPPKEFPLPTPPTEFRDRFRLRSLNADERRNRLFATLRDDTPIGKDFSEEVGRRMNEPKYNYTYLSGSLAGFPDEKILLLAKTEEEVLFINRKLKAYKAMEDLTSGLRSCMQNDLAARTPLKYVVIYRLDVGQSNAAGLPHEASLPPPTVSRPPTDPAQTDGSTSRQLDWQHLGFGQNGYTYDQARKEEKGEWRLPTVAEMKEISAGVGPYKDIEQTVIRNRPYWTGDPGNAERVKSYCFGREANCNWAKDSNPWMESPKNDSCAVLLLPRNR